MNLEEALIGGIFLLTILIGIISFLCDRKSHSQPSYMDLEDTKAVNHT